MAEQSKNVMVRTCSLKKGKALSFSFVRSARPAFVMCHAVLVMLCLAKGAFAQPRLTSISPQWIQRGTTLDVTLSGDRLGSVTGFVFSGDAGISGDLPAPAGMPKARVAVESQSGAFSVIPAAKPGNEKSLAVHLTVATNAAL